MQEMMRHTMYKLGFKDASYVDNVQPDRSIVRERRMFLPRAGAKPMIGELKRLYIEKLFPASNHSAYALRIFSMQTASGLRFMPLHQGYASAVLSFLNLTT